jgi:hypothetical protein
LVRSGCRYSEVDAIDGIVVAEGETLGRPALGNAAVVELTQLIFSRQLTPDPANLDQFLALLDGVA